MHSSKQKSKLSSVDKALRTLMVLSESGSEGMSLSEISAVLNVNNSSLHATMSALKFRNFVKQNMSNRRYLLGDAIGKLAGFYLQQFDIRNLIRPSLLKLSSQINEVCHISVLEGKDVFYIEKIESTKPIQPGTQIGSRLPAVNTAMGRTMIAVLYQNYESFARVFGLGYEPRTPFAPKTIEKVWEKIEEVKRNGYAVDLQENVIGLCAIAFGIMIENVPVGAVSIVTLASECDSKGPLKYHDPLLRCLKKAISPPMKIFQGINSKRKL